MCVQHIIHSHLLPSHIVFQLRSDDCGGHFECTELMLKKPVGDNLNFVNLHDGHKVMDMVNNNTQVNSSGILLRLLSCSFVCLGCNKYICLFLSYSCLPINSKQSGIPSLTSAINEAFSPREWIRFQTIRCNEDCVGKS